MRKQFFLVFFSLIRLSLDVKDKYLKIRLINKVSGLFSSFLNFEKRENRENVAQYSLDFKNLFSLLDELMEFVEILEHLKAVDLSPALSAKKSLLSFKAKVLDFLFLSRDQITQLESRDNKPEQPQVQNVKTRTKKEKKDLRAEERILDFVRNRGESSAKEIVLAFAGAISKRTIQRHLTKLAKNNGLKKKDDGNVVKYYIV